jgi:hypothetical protein
VIDQNIADHDIDEPDELTEALPQSFAAATAP